MRNDPKRRPRGGEKVRYRDLRFFFRFVRPVWPLGVASIFLGLVAVGLASLLPLSTKAIIDFVLMGKDPERITTLLGAIGWEAAAGPVHRGLQSVNVVLLAVLLISMAAGMLRLLQRVLTVHFQHELMFRLQTALIDHVLRFPLPFFRRRLSGYVVSRILSDVSAVQSLFSQQIEQLATHLFRVGCGLVLVYFLSPTLTLVALGVLPVYVAINCFFSDKVRGLWQQVMERQARVTEHLQETIDGVEVMKAYGGEKRALDRASARLRTVMRFRFRGIILSFLSSNLVGAVQLLVTLLITWCGVREVREGRMSVGDFAAFSSYLVFLIAPVRSLAMFHMGLQPTLASLDRLAELFRMVPEMDSGEDRRRGTLPAVRGEVEFRKVDFRYEEGATVLRNINVRASPGEVIALVGPSGAGKTTLVSLILAFERPEHGVVLLDGRDVRTLKMAWLREQIGYVSQTCFLFADTVRNNIRYGRPDASDAEVEAAAERACVQDEIRQLSRGYDTMLGGNGTGLSMGQQQRISIARCFLKDPPIVIFDEPSSALDARSEALLKESFRRLVGHRTVFIIAHRLSTINVADRIVVLDQGCIVESGTHDQLMQSCGLYKELRDRQSGQE